MYVLGVNPGIYKITHDSSAALIKDGKIIAFSSQDRFDRIKHSCAFPTDAINFCLNFAKIKDSDVDVIAISWNPEKIIKAVFSHPFKVFNTHNAYNRIIIFRHYAAVMEAVNMLRRRFGKKVVMVDHHLAHAASTFYVSGFDRSNVLTMDGRGEKDASVAFVGEGNELRKKYSINFFNNHSFGLCYTRMTDIIGLGRFGEGKTMGLAPYGNPSFDFSDIIAFRPGGKSLANYAKISRFNRYGRTKNEEIGQVHKDLAASLQKAMEETIVKMSLELKDMTGIDKLCLAGGTTLNCKTNGLIVDTKKFSDVYVQPAASDDGTALGAAMYAYVSTGNKPKTVMDHAYWGPEFTNEEIEAALRAAGEKYEFHSDIAGVTAELLGKGKIVGWFQGRMEVGPRALGNRTILGDPSLPGMADRLNEVKTREKWRPLAPSMLEEAMEEYFGFKWPSPFMILSFNVLEEKRKEIAASVHVDGSTRPQTVNSRTNAKYYDLIKKFESISGIPVVMNTSFNDNTEPIVCTPQNAIRTFHASKMDCLSIGNFLLKK